MPFITEEIWQRVKSLAGVEGETIMLQPFPMADADLVDHTATADIEWLKGVIVGVRNIRGEIKISPAKHIPVLFQSRSGKDSDGAEAQRRLEENRNFLLKLANLESAQWLQPGEEAPMSATALVGNTEVLVPMAGLIDKDAELGRLHKELEKLNKSINQVEGKLGNAKFVDNAPDAVVAKERAKLEEAQAAKTTLQEQHDKIAAL